MSTEASNTSSGSPAPPPKQPLTVGQAVILTLGAVALALIAYGSVTDTKGSGGSRGVAVRDSEQIRLATETAARKLDSPALPGTRVRDVATVELMAPASLEVGALRFDSPGRWVDGTDRRFFVVRCPVTNRGALPLDLVTMDVKVLDTDGARIGEGTLRTTADNLQPNGFTEAEGALELRGNPPTIGRFQAIARVHALTDAVPVPLPPPTEMDDSPPPVPAGDEPDPYERPAQGPSLPRVRITTEADPVVYGGVELVRVKLTLTNREHTPYRSIKVRVTLYDYGSDLVKSVNAFFDDVPARGTLHLTTAEIPFPHSTIDAVRIETRVFEAEPGQH